MTRTVVFLGAGASAPLGLPVTNMILPDLLLRLDGKGPDGTLLFEADDVARERLRRSLQAILPGLAGVVAGITDAKELRDVVPPVTDILSAIDHFLAAGNVPDPEFSRRDLVCARGLLERGIFELLVSDTDPDDPQMAHIPDVVNEEWAETRHRRMLPARQRSALLGATAQWVTGLASGANDRVTVISTNYDIEVEQELYARHGNYETVFTEFDFGTKIRHPAEPHVFQRPHDAKLGIYKLHGSLNWLRCDFCDNIYVNPLGAIAYLSFLLDDDDAGQRAQNAPYLKQLADAGANTCHCGHRPLRHVLVAPSLVRDIRDPILLEIWRNALEALRQADRWIIVGYSLPPEDLAIRSMLQRAWQAAETRGANWPAVEVIQKTEAEKPRYELLFPGHEYKTGGLEDYLRSLRGG